MKNINEVLASPGNISMAYLIPSFIGNFVYFQRENMDKKLTPRGGVWMTSFVASNMAAVSKHDFYFPVPLICLKNEKKNVNICRFLDNDHGSIVSIKVKTYCLLLQCLKEESAQKFKGKNLIIPEKDVTLKISFMTSLCICKKFRADFVKLNL